MIDAHVHLWDTRVLRYPWLDGEPDLLRVALWSDLAAAAPGAPPEFRVEGIIVVQAECEPLQAEQEVQWLTEQRARGAPIAGVVAYAPLEGMQFGSMLERYALDPRVVGVRRNIQHESPGFARQLASGVRALADYQLSFDICAQAEQLDDVIGLVDSAPDTRFVLDHLGKPVIGSEETKAWKRHLTELAYRPNVVCKLSGLATEAPPGWSFADLAPYLAHAIESFGLDRLLFGSDWPVSTRATTYAEWVEAVLASVPTEGISRVYGGNARKVYGLDEGARRHG